MLAFCSIKRTCYSATNVKHVQSLRVKNPGNTQFHASSLTVKTASTCINLYAPQYLCNSDVSHYPLFIRKDGTYRELKKSTTKSYIRNQCTLTPEQTSVFKLRGHAISRSITSSFGVLGERLWCRGVFWWVGVTSGNPPSLVPCSSYIMLQNQFKEVFHLPM